MNRGQRAGGGMNSTKGSGRAFSAEEGARARGPGQGAGVRGQSPCDGRMESEGEGSRVGAVHTAPRTGRATV